MSGLDLALLGQLPWDGIAFGALLGGAVLAWQLAGRAREPAAPVRVLPQILPNRDPVSVAVDALDSNRYGKLLERARSQLSAFSIRDTGRPLEQLPGPWSAWRHPPTPSVRTLRRLRRRIDRLSDRAAWRARSWVPRGDVWRSPERSAAHFRHEVAVCLQDLGQLTRSREMG